MADEHKRVCQWEGCDVDLSAMHPNNRYCYQQSVEAKRARQRVPNKRPAPAGHQTPKRWTSRTRAWQICPAGVSTHRNAGRRVSGAVS